MRILAPEELDAKPPSLEILIDKPKMELVYQSETFKKDQVSESPKL
jgi:hypothetical protein